MDFTIKNIDKNIVVVARELGYVIIDTNENGYNLVRKLAGDNYPRFHIYVKQAGTDFIFSLHLDQKKPIYKGAHAHNGEYFGPVVDAEAERIKTVLEQEDSQ
jgi:excinuclease UvrABC nuclease subunit